MENKNRNSFKSVQTLVMCLSSSGYDIHKYILVEPQTFSPVLLVNIKSDLENLDTHSHRGCIL